MGEVSSTVRFRAMRIPCSIFANACSIGLRSGEQAGGCRSRAPAVRSIRRISADLCEPRLSMTTMSPRWRVGTSTWATWARKHGPLIGPPRTRGPVRRSCRRAPRKVTVRHGCALRRPTGACPSASIPEAGPCSSRSGSRRWTPAWPDRGQTEICASAGAGGRCRPAPAQARTAFPSNRSPWRRRNCQPVSCETFAPRAANSSFGPCRVRWASVHTLGDERPVRPNRPSRRIVCRNTRSFPR